MKKHIVILAVGTAVLFLLSGCSSSMSAKGATEADFLYRITGKTNSKKVYWKTAADGVSSVKASKGTYSISELPKRLKSYKVSLSSAKDFKKSTSVTVPKTSSLGKVDSVAGRYDGYLFSQVGEGNYYVMPSALSEGENLIGDKHGVELSCYVNDGKVTGFEVVYDTTKDNDDDSATFLSDSFIGVVHAVGGDDSVASKMIVNATKKKNDGHQLRNVTHGVTITGLSVNREFLYLRAFKK